MGFSSILLFPKIVRTIKLSEYGLLVFTTLGKCPHPTVGGEGPYLLSIGYWWYIFILLFSIKNFDFSSPFFRSPFLWLLISVSTESSVLIVANPYFHLELIKINFPGKIFKMKKIEIFAAKNGILDTVVSGDFTLGPHTEAYYACTAVFNGETLVFGGMREPNQVFFDYLAEIIKKNNLVQLCWKLWLKKGWRFTIHWASVFASILWRFQVPSTRGQSLNLPPSTMFHVSYESCFFYFI